MGTTSSIVQFVQSLNAFFQCPSENGKCKGNLYIGLLVHESLANWNHLE